MYDVAVWIIFKYFSIKISVIWRFQLVLVCLLVRGNQYLVFEVMMDVMLSFYRCFS